MRQIVGARIGTMITNNRSVIREAFEAGRVTEFLDRERMQFMAGMDLGRNWELMANGPTLFCLDDEGKPHAPNAGGFKRPDDPGEWEAWQARAAISQASSGTWLDAVAWQGMDTAPKDGSEFVIRNTLQGNVKNLVCWNSIHGYWQSKGGWINVIACEWHPIEFTTASASAIETAAIMKCAEVCDEFPCGVTGAELAEHILTLIPQDGRTQLEEFGMLCAREAFYQASNGVINDADNNLRAIVTNLMNGSGK